MTQPAKTEPGLCAQCGNRFPAEQVCNACHRRHSERGVRIVGKLIALVIIAAAIFALGLGCYALFKLVTGQ